MRKGDELTLTIEKFADRGKSLTRLDGYVVFVPGAVPGDKVLARVVRKKKKFAEARLVELITPSPLRTTPTCTYFGSCGGCKLQHVQYEAQLDAKRQSVVEALQFQGGMENIEVNPIIGAEEQFRYRNKMEYTFSSSRWLTSEEIASDERFDTSFALGMHAPGRFNRVIDLQTCYLPAEISVRLLNGFRQLAKAERWDCWDVRKHVGYLRNLVVRTGQRTGDLMVNVVTNGFDADRFDRMTEYVKASFPEVTTFLNTCLLYTSDAADE